MTDRNQVISLTKNLIKMKTKLLYLVLVICTPMAAFSQEISLPNYTFESDVAGHLRGNKIALLGFTKYTKSMGTYGLEFGVIYDYHFKRLAANRVHNQTALDKSTLNWQINLTKTFSIGHSISKDRLKRFYAGAKIGYTSINYTHNQLVPSNSGQNVTAFEILNNNEMMNNTFQSKNHRIDLLPSIGWNTISSIGISYDFFIAGGISMNFASTEQTHYELINGATTQSLRSSQGFEARNEKWLGFNANGKIGFNAVPVIQIGAKLGWTQWKKVKK